MSKIYRKNCQYCGKYYEGWGKLYCSNNCKNKDRAENDLGWRRKNREHWKRLWNNPPEKMRKWLIHISENPIWKGKKHSEETKKKQRDAKLGKYRGKDNPNWKGENAKTPKLQRLRNSIQYREWRQKVFRRDDYTCQMCGRRSRKGDHVDLQADHIKSFALYPELRFVVGNGRTLCVECHKTTKTYGWKGGFIL